MGLFLKSSGLMLVNNTENEMTNAEQMFTTKRQRPSLNTNAQFAVLESKAYVLSSTKWMWGLMGVWGLYSAFMLWHFKELTNFNAAICAVVR